MLKYVKKSNFFRFCTLKLAKNFNHFFDSFKSKRLRLSSVEQKQSFAIDICC